MTINKNSVEQINVALLDMDKKIKSAISNGTSASDFKNLEASVDNIKRTLDEAKAGLEPGKTYNINISGNAATADKATTATTAEKATNANHAETATTAEAATTATIATKASNALTVNGKTYNGSEAVDAGVQTVENGGTGVTTQADINRAFIGNLEVGTSDVTDGTEFVSSWASDNGFAETTDGANTPYKRQFIKVWNYIKGKISSVLGLTKDNYGGKASTARTADVANALAGRGGITNTGTFQNVMNNDGKWYVPDLNLGWSGSFYSFHAGGSQSGLMFRIRGGSRDIRNIEVNYSVDSNQFAGPWTPLIGRIPTSAPSSPQDGDIWIER